MRPGAERLPSTRATVPSFSRYFRGVGIAVAVEAQPSLVPHPGLVFRLVTVVTLLTGTMFLMWLGEQITERGLGNGISIIIFSGIAAGLPKAIAGLLELVRTGAMHPDPRCSLRFWSGWFTTFVVFVERGQRRFW